MAHFLFCLGTPVCGPPMALLLMALLLWTAEDRNGDD
jgi:hypothetical protein